MNSDIVDRYMSGESACALAKKFGFAKQSVLLFLRKRGVKIRSSKEVVRAVSDSDELKLVELYLNGISLNRLHKQFDMYISTIVNILKRHKIPIRSHLRSVNYSNINLPTSGSEFFYYLGLMLSDGWIYERKHSIIAGLGMKDMDVIKFIRDSFSPNRKIYYDTKIYRVLFPISAKYRDFLASWGCIRRKSLILKPTDNLNNMTQNQFYQMLVGIIEGDGSILFRTKAIQIYSGSYEFCKYIVERIGFGHIGTATRTDKKRSPHPTFYCRWSHKQARRLAQLLLNSDILKMDRKWNTARKWLLDDDLKIKRALDIILNCKCPSDDIKFANKWQMNVFSIRNIRLGRRWVKLRNTHSNS